MFGWTRLIASSRIHAVVRSTKTDDEDEDDDDDDDDAIIACYPRAITYLPIPNHEVSLDNLMLITYRIDSFSRINV